MGCLISVCISSVAMGMTWCFCTAASSLCSACFGSDPSTPPSATSGRKRSVFLLVISIGLAFAFQYGVAPALAPHSSSAFAKLPEVGQYLVDSWNDGCDDYGSEELREKCSGNAGVFRASGSSTLFFLLAAVAASLKPTANNEAWPAKYILFLSMVAGTIFIPNKPFFLDIYLNIGRLGGIIFILLQQIILIDLAYNWNDSWVSKSNAAEREERGSGQKWLNAILVSCGVLFVGSITVIGLLYHYFSGCSNNETFISITLIMCVIITIVQLQSEESSLLTSAVITAYATYLALTAVTKNPNGECNPKLGDNDVLGMILGIGFTVLSLAWTGWSYTADTTLVNPSNRNSLVEMSFPLVENEHSTRGSVVTSSDLEEYEIDVDSSTVEEETSSTCRSWKLNIVLALISCWFGMALTGWGSIQESGNEANPEVSTVSMWMIISSQWIVLSLYLWTLVAPTLFPDRDFS